MEKTIDLTHAKNALFIRQAVALAFGVPIDQELTWEVLHERLCTSTGLEIPERILVRGLPQASIHLSEECQMLRNLLKALGTARGIVVQIVLH
jgi:hypothetical protein